MGNENHRSKVFDVIIIGLLIIIIAWVWDISKKNKEIVELREVMAALLASEQNYDILEKLVKNKNPEELNLDDYLPDGVEYVINENGDGEFVVTQASIGIPNNSDKLQDRTPDTQKRDEKKMTCAEATRELESAKTSDGKAKATINVLLYCEE